MKHEHERIGQLLFLGAAGLALAIYGLTAPAGLPWNASTQLAAAYLGETVRLPAMPHPIWGFHVQVAGGAVALSVVLAALAAGLLAAAANRRLGWRFAAAAALVWIFLPGVWNRAVTGERGVCLASMAVAAVWAANVVMIWALRRVRAARKSAPAAAGGGGGPAAVAHDVSEKRAKVNRIAGWAALGAAGVFAAVSASMHDYRLGEAASVYAKGVVEASDGRIIVLNGVCDEQIVREVLKKGGDKNIHCPSRLATLALRNDDAYRVKLVAWVKAAFPSETNLWVAAQVGATAFAEAAVGKHPERFYLMSGASAKMEDWKKRWEDFAPYLKSQDPFVPMGRRMFGCEGNWIANALQEGEGEPQTAQPSPKLAWQTYKRIYEEIDPGNFSALVNMNEMIRRGHAVGGEEKKAVQGALDAFFKDAQKRQHAREIARAAGPVRTDVAALAKMEEEAKRRIAERIAAGEKLELPPEVLSLVEWNNEMVQAMGKGELAQAGRLARKILSNPKWRDFIPANATMGTVAASEGDYAASEAFFRAATETTNAVPAVVLNDYADTLMHLGKTAEAERMARRAVAESDETFWLARLTLAEVLLRTSGKSVRIDVFEGGERRDKYVTSADAEKLRAEARALLTSVLAHAPSAARDEAKKLLREAKAPSGQSVTP